MMMDIEIRESAPPVDALGESHWHIEQKRYINATEYRVCTPDACIASFTDVSELRNFGDLLRNDLASGRDIPKIVREAYGQIIAAIDAIGA